MAYDPLFQALAQAESQPSRGYRAFNAATEAATSPIQGYLQTKAGLADIAEKKLKPYEIYSKIAESAGPHAANAIFQKMGIPVPDTKSSSGVPTIASASPNPSIGGNEGDEYSTDELVNSGKFGANILGNKEKGLTIQNNAPFSPDVANFIGNGDVAGLSKYHASRGEPVPYREIAQAISAKRPNMMGGYFDTRAGSLQLGQLPSQMPTGTVPGSAAAVKLAARQGRSLIAKATSPQNLKLASVDLTRAVARMAPDAATIGESNYGNTLPTMVGRLTQLLDSDPTSPDVPKLRKQIYDTLGELDKSATPFILNHLANMESNGMNSSFGKNWDGVKQRELGQNIPDIPFDDGSAQNPNVATGIPQKPTTMKQGEFTYTLNPQTGNYE